MTAAAGAAGCIFFYDIIYDINFAPVTSAPSGVVKRVEMLSSFPAISLSRAGNGVLQCTTTTTTTTATRGTTEWRGSGKKGVAVRRRE